MRFVDPQNQYTKVKVSLRNEINMSPATTSKKLKDNSSITPKIRTFKSKRRDVGRFRRKESFNSTDEKDSESVDYKHNNSERLSATYTDHSDSSSFYSSLHDEIGDSSGILGTKSADNYDVGTTATSQPTTARSQDIEPLALDVVSGHSSENSNTISAQGDDKDKPRRTLQRQGSNYFEETLGDDSIQSLSGHKSIRSSSGHNVHRSSDGDDGKSSPQQSELRRRLVRRFSFDGDEARKSEARKSPSQRDRRKRLVRSLSFDGGEGLRAPRQQEGTGTRFMRRFSNDASAMPQQTESQLPESLRRILAKDVVDQSTNLQDLQILSANAEDEEGASKQSEVSYARKFLQKFSVDTSHHALNSDCIPPNSANSRNNWSPERSSRRTRLRSKSLSGEDFTIFTKTGSRGGSENDSTHSAKRNSRNKSASGGEFAAACGAKKSARGLSRSKSMGGEEFATTFGARKGKRNVMANNGKTGSEEPAPTIGARRGRRNSMVNDGKTDSEEFSKKFGARRGRRNSMLGDSPTVSIENNSTRHSRSNPIGNESTRSQSGDVQPSLGRRLITRKKSFDEKSDLSIINFIESRRNRVAVVRPIWECNYSQAQGNHEKEKEFFAGVIDQKFEEIKQQVKASGFVTNLGFVQISRGVVAERIVHDLEENEPDLST